MSNVEEVIHLLVAPVVMISACGLLCLALYARLAAVVSRARAFNKERAEAMAELADESPEGAVARQHRHRAEMLDDQVQQILRRARLVRSALVLLLATVLCMLACSLALGVTLFVPACANVALGLFVLGMLCSAGGVTLAIRELVRALDPVALEHARLDAAGNRH